MAVWASIILAADVDAADLNFDEGSLLLLNILIGLMMFGMALGIDTADFRALTSTPKPASIGLGAQFILLPFATFLITLALDLPASIELGMLLVASCPGGNFSNIMTYLGKGNAPLSVGMTAVSTAAAIFMTPLNFSIWGRLNPDTEPILRTVSLDPIDLFITIVLILGLPLLAGIGLANWRPAVAKRLEGPAKGFSVVVFLAFIGFALAGNWDNFITYIGSLVLIVAVHNAVAFLLGFASSRVAGLAPRDCRAVTFEVGLQNSALALVLVFNFFDGLGGMALIAAWWGVWHIVAGLSLAGFWSRRPLAVEAEAAA